MRVEAAEVAARVHMPDLMPGDRKVVKVGRSAYRAQCPIHGGDNLSFGMKDDGRGWWFNCWACGEKGGVFALVMALERCTFKEALERLAKDVAPLLGGPAPKRHKPALLLACDTRGCGETREIEAADRPYVGRTIAIGWELRAGRWECPRCGRWRASVAEHVTRKAAA